MNGDGELDLISGCYEGGLFLLKGLSDGEYDTPEPVLDKEGAYVRLGQYWCRENDVWTDTDLEHGISGVPIDWDDDGDLDLLLGASSGHVFRRMNEGSATEYSFATENVQVHAAGEPIGAPGGAMVITADWDRAPRGTRGRWGRVAFDGYGDSAHRGDTVRAPHPLC